MKNLTFIALLTDLYERGFEIFNENFTAKNRVIAIKYTIKGLSCASAGLTKLHRLVNVLIPVLANKALQSQLI